MRRSTFKQQSPARGRSSTIRAAHSPRIRGDQTPDPSRRPGGAERSSKPLPDPHPCLLPVDEIEKANLGSEENRPRQLGHPGFPPFVADNGTALDLPGMADVELDLVPQGPQFDTIKVGHFHQAADAAVVLDQLFQHGYEPLVVLVQELAADPHPEDLSRALIQSLDHRWVLPSQVRAWERATIRSSGSRACFSRRERTHPRMSLHLYIVPTGTQRINFPKLNQS